MNKAIVAVSESSPRYRICIISAASPPVSLVSAVKPTTFNHFSVINSHSPLIAADRTTCGGVDQNCALVVRALYG